MTASRPQEDAQAIARKIAVFDSLTPNEEGENLIKEIRSLPVDTFQLLLKEIKENRLAILIIQGKLIPPLIELVMRSEITEQEIFPSPFMNGGTLTEFFALAINYSESVLNFHDRIKALHQHFEWQRKTGLLVGEFNLKHVIKNGKQVFPAVLCNDDCIAVLPVQEDENLILIKQTIKTHVIDNVFYPAHFFLCERNPQNNMFSVCHEIHIPNCYQETISDRRVVVISEQASELNQEVKLEFKQRSGGTPCLENLVWINILIDKDRKRFVEHSRHLLPHDFCRSQVTFIGFNQFIYATPMQGTIDRRGYYDLSLYDFTGPTRIPSRVARIGCASAATKNAVTPIGTHAIVFLDENNGVWNFHATQRRATLLGHFPFGNSLHYSISYLPTQEAVRIFRYTTENSRYQDFDVRPLQQDREELYHFLKSALLEIPRMLMPSVIGAIVLSYLSFTQDDLIYDVPHSPQKKMLGKIAWLRGEQRNRDQHRQQKMIEMKPQDEEEKCSIFVKDTLYELAFLTKAKDHLPDPDRCSVIAERRKHFDFFRPVSPQAAHCLFEVADLLDDFSKPDLWMDSRLRKSKTS